MTNEGRADKAAEDIGHCTYLAEGGVAAIILAAINEATAEYLKKLADQDNIIQIQADVLNGYTARIAGLKDALRPFARAAVKKVYFGRLGDPRQGIYLVHAQDIDIDADPDLSVGDLRAAAKVMEEDK